MALAKVLNLLLLDCTFCFDVSGQWDGEMQVACTPERRRGIPRARAMVEAVCGSLESRLWPVSRTLAAGFAVVDPPTVTPSFATAVVGTSNKPLQPPPRPTPPARAVPVFCREVDVMEGRGAAFVPAGSSAFGVPVASSAATGYVFFSCALEGWGGNMGEAAWRMPISVCLGGATSWMIRAR